MPLKCYTCGQQIDFDDGVLSKTGKKIPLTVDKKMTHGHDESGKAVNKPLEQGQVVKQQQQQEVKPSSSGYTTTGQSQGGAYMDTKRLRVMTEELQKQTNALDEKIEACYQLAKSNNNMLGELIQFFKINDPKSAAELYQAMNNTKQEALKPAEVKGWNSVIPTPGRGEKQQDFPVEKTLIDDEDEDEKSEKEES